MPGIRVQCVGLVLAIASFGAAPSGRGEEAVENRTGAPRWGTQDRILSHIPFTDFDPENSGTTYFQYSTPSTLGRYATSILNRAFVAIAKVPSGALLTYVELDYCDTSPTYGVDLIVNECTYQGGDCFTLAFLSSDTGSLGCHLVTKDLTPQGYTMDNNARELLLIASTKAGDETTVLNGVYIGYKLQISQAPALPTFADVPTTHPYYRAIEALVSAGITVGCGGSNFCPGQNLTRGEMAVFLARALGLHFVN